MKMRLLTVITIITMVLISTTGLLAQDLNIGIDYFLAGELDVAKHIIQKNINTEPAKAYYYLGDIEYKKGNLDQAKALYTKGLESDPAYALNQIGLNKILLNVNPKEGMDNLYSMSRDKVFRRDADVLVEIARAYYDNKLDQEAGVMLEAAEKASRRAPSIALFKGDMQKDAEKVGEAAVDYEQATLNDPKLAMSYIKIAQLYLKVSTSYAIEKLLEVKQMYPDYPLADKYLARAYYFLGQYDKAIEIYDDYFSIEGLARRDDLTSYAASLFFTGDFKKAETIIQAGLRGEPDNFVFNRLSMYSALETESDGGVQQAEKFFSVPLGDNEYIIRDYTTYAELLLRGGYVDKGDQMYAKAMEIADNTEELKSVCKLASETLGKVGCSAQSAGFMQQYINNAGEAAEAMDYYKMGQALYRAATIKMRDTVDVNAPELVVEYLNKADAAFKEVSERIPTSHLGPIFRARVNALKDPDTLEGLARPYYEETLNMLIEKEDVENYSREILEAYRYLSYYHYVQFEENGVQRDKELTIEFSKKMLELDPDNHVANQLLQALGGN